MELKEVIAVLCLTFAGCIVTSDGYEPLTHAASLRNIGKQEVLDAVLFFGPGGYEVGILPSGIGANISRPGDNIPKYAGAEWKRADGSCHKGKVRIEKPQDMSQRERYVIQIDDDNKLTLKVEFPKPIPGAGNTRR